VVKEHVQRVASSVGAHDDGRLDVVSPGAVDGWSMPEKVEVWVLGAGSGSRDRRQGWSRRYSVQVVGVEQRLAWPHFAHGGHALTMDSKSCVFTHRMRAAGALQCGEVQSVRISEEGQVMLSGINGGSIRGVFAYVKTQDPLSAYRSQAS
jgi:hypothetical protein